MIAGLNKLVTRRLLDYILGFYYQFKNSSIEIMVENYLHDTHSVVVVLISGLSSG